MKLLRSSTRLRPIKNSGDLISNRDRSCNIGNASAQNNPSKTIPWPSCPAANSAETAWSPKVMASGSQCVERCKNQNPGDFGTADFEHEIYGARLAEEDNQWKTIKWGTIARPHATPLLRPCPTSRRHHIRPGTQTRAPLTVRTLCTARQKSRGIKLLSTFVLPTGADSHVDPPTRNWWDEHMRFLPNGTRPRKRFFSAKR